MSCIAAPSRILAPSVESTDRRKFGSLPNDVAQRRGHSCRGGIQCEPLHPDRNNPNRPKAFREGRIAT